MRILSILLISTFLSGCSIGRLPDNLALAMMDQEQPVIVEAGAPAYLLLLDALILTYPEDQALLLSGAKLYGAYAGVFARDEEQAKYMANRAFAYAKRALCESKRACVLLDSDQSQFEQQLAENIKTKDIDLIYGFASAWLGWIQANSDDWNAIAQLSKVKSLMRWTAEQQPGYDNAMVQVYLGALETLVPPSLGGKPELGREHFERAIKLSDGHNLMAYVIYAKQYARLMFDQELHDSLLKQALAADPKYTGLTLINRLAQQQATNLLNDSAEYFE